MTAVLCSRLQNKKQRNSPRHVLLLLRKELPREKNHSNLWTGHKDADVVGLVGGLGSPLLPVMSSILD